MTKAMCGAECFTDHRLIISKVNIVIKPKRRPRGKSANKRLNVRKLAPTSIKEKLQNEFERKLSDLDFGSGTAEKNWECFRDNIYETSLDILGKNTHKHQDWFDENDEEIMKLSERNLEAYTIHQQDILPTSKKTAYNSIKSKAKACQRAMQNFWLSQKAYEIQMLADTHSLQFFDALKSIYGLASSVTSPLLKSDGSQLLTEKSAIFDRWTEHFENVLNRPSTINEAAIALIPQVETNFSLDEPLTEEEVLKAIKLLSGGKAPGTDAILAEI